MERTNDYTLQRKSDNRSQRETEYALAGFVLPFSQKLGTTDAEAQADPP